MKRCGLSAVVALLLTLLASQGAFGLSVLMLTDSSGSMTSVESTLKSRLESAGFTVNTLWDGDSQSNYTAAFANNDVVYVPSDVSATDIGTKLRTCNIGVVNELVGFMDDLGLCTTAGTTTSVSTITIATNSHYITSPFVTGAFTVGFSTYAVSQVGGTTASGAVILATVGGVNSIVAVDTGGTLANTISSNSTASGRRVQMPIQCGVVDTATLSSNMQTMLVRIVQWAALFDGKLEAQWKLNETSGTSAADSSGNSRTGTVTGTASWVSAVLNNGFSFNGSTKIQATGLMGNPRNVSVAAWANLTTTDTTGAEVISLGDHFVLRLDDSGATKAIFYNGSSYVTATVSQTFAGTGWHHFAAVFDDGHDTLKLYIDGTLAATTTTTSSVSWSGLGSNTVIGRNGNGGTASDFTGTLDEVRVYSYAISATEVAQLFGLIGRWKLNETSGTTAIDATPFGRDATLTGAASWSSDCGGMGVFNFDGASNYFTVANTTDFQPTGMISMSAWVKGNVWKDSSGGDVDAILRKGDATPNNYSLAIASGKVMLLLDDSDTVGIRGNTVLNPGQWYHVAATWDGTTAKIYVNGVLDNSPGTAKAAPISTDTRPLYIGGRPGTDYFDGMIRDARIYNRPLTATELVQGSGLVGWWKFSEGSGTSAADSSGMGNTVTLAASAGWTSDCAGNNNALLTNGAASGTASTTAAFNPPDVGTVAFWLRSTGAPGGVARIIGLGGDWELRQQVNGTVVTDLCGDGGSTICTVTPLTEVGRWYHVAFTFDSSNNTYAIYVDGQLEASGTNSVDMVQQAAAVLSFGTRTGATEYWSGALRDVRVYNRKLCPSEIQSLYGLLLYWKMDETSGSVASDSSGLGNSGSVVGTAAWAAGKINDAVQLNGSTRVEVASLMGSPKNVTLAGWANLTSPDSGGAELISIGDYFAIRLKEGGSVQKAFFHNSSTWLSASTSQSLSSGWHHFAAVFNDDADYCKLYIDGLEAASLSTATSIAYTGAGTKTIVGAHGNGQTTYDFTGKVDDVRIYNRALCPTEIQQIKNLGGTFGGVKITKWTEVQ
jgi:hypothetical protein